ncbi:MAG: hypothetical protein JXA04_06240 [Gammaproteobacteria bacterium]|nr:hypothetical protein [Gammaproteobacteria bacterium]
MRHIFRATSMLVVTVGVLAYGSYLITGRLPWQGISFKNQPDIGLPEMPSLPKIKAARQLVYKWKDADDIWQFSSEPPADDLPYEQLEINPDANTIESVSIASEEQAPVKPDIKIPSEANGNGMDLPYLPRGVKKLMEDARSVQKALNERAENQEETVDNL